MTIFSYHLLELSFVDGIKNLLSNPIPKNIQGLTHAEYMTAMTLGSPILSPSRVLLKKVVVFMQWKEEAALEEFLANNHFGKQLSKGWHVRLEFLRKWGQFSGYEIPSESKKNDNPNSTVVAITIARMKPLAIPRFIHWGRPVEKLVRDHSGTTLSLASIKFPNTVSTFSIWKSVTEMTDMVNGHSSMDKPKRHSDAMKERQRKNFHYEFTTLRFKPLAEFGTWNNRSDFTLLSQATS